MTVIKRRPLTKDELKVYCDAIEKYIEKNMEETMGENYIMLNGKRIDLTDEQIEKLGLKEKNDVFERKIGRGYCCFNSYGEISDVLDTDSSIDQKLYEVGNYCTDKKLIEQRALHETLSRLLWRFSMQNDGDKIDWSNRSRKKYLITYDCRTEKFEVDSIFSATYGCNLKYHLEYFYSVERARRAIDEIIVPFMKEHPEFVW